MKPSPHRACTVRAGVTALCLLAAHQMAAAQTAPVCEHDAAVTERFIPVEMLTGNSMPETRELKFTEVDRRYPYIDVHPSGKLGAGDVTLKGPLKYVGYAGKEFEVYERTVPRSYERFALTPDGTAIGRVFDQRFGQSYNEGKFPVGLWQQGQKRSYDTLYGQRSAVSSIEVEKLSCTYDGIAGALQYRWKTNNGLDYAYVYAPGRGIVQVFTYKNGR
ncbi:hypothetical protein [Variovorax sp. EBFNA2]|uniref:hypothetical protein n=1 Tax=Variovorax sp. EBFNA2 TaxID=3342097 RepID=UPI0029BFD46C|nr:hypothetical protein [Variovorax boronicumulans]WPG40376.1 hypothetical protein RZE79_13830 [Variovorax boronicumulans]